MNALESYLPEEPPVAMAGIGVRSLRDEKTVVVDRVNWEVRPGDYWVLAGLQGSGKTDFLMTLAGLTPPAHGSYELFGEKMPIFDEVRMATRLRLGMVFENGQLFNHLTIRDNISLPLRYHQNRSKAEVESELNELLDMVGLAPFAESTPGGVGRNWQKRAGLARALALKPEILLVDSPLAGLDPRHMKWWMGFLETLSKGHPWLGNRPMTLVVTAADLRPWRSGTRRFAALRDRQFVVLGSWQQLETESQELLRELSDDHLSEGDRV